MNPARTRVKICGLTTHADVAMAVEAGADAVGFILAQSPRRLALRQVAELVRAVPPYVAKVAVVADPSDDEAAALRRLGLTLQFNGGESAAECARLCGGDPYVKAFAVEAGASAEAHLSYEEYAGATWMFDTRLDDRLGGTGVPFAWSAVAPLARERPIIVAGGLSPGNVGACVDAVHPYAVDVRSGVETDGRKDADKMRAFVRAVRETDARA